MIVLAFDTSTFQGSVGWVSFENDGTVKAHAEMTAPSKPGHAERLLSRIDAVLETGDFTMKDVDLVVCGLGPGTFTGLRIGLATAKGLSIANNTPIVGLSTLKSMALSSGIEGTVVPVVDARRGEVYLGAYNVRRTQGIPKATLVLKEQVIPKDNITKQIENLSRQSQCFAIGTGAQVYKEFLGESVCLLPQNVQTPSACLMAITGYNQFKQDGADDALTLEPNYLREPDAKLPQK